MKHSRSDNRGFSLVELIIVVALMVTLIAVLAPQYTKFVHKSNDAVVSSSAQNVFTVAKVEFIAGNLTLDGERGTITVGVPGGTGNIEAELSNNLHYSDAGDPTLSFNDVCGITANRRLNTDKSYIITIEMDGAVPRFSMAEPDSDSD